MNLLSLVSLWLDNICQIKIKILRYRNPKFFPGTGGGRESKERTRRPSHSHAMQPSTPHESAATAPPWPWAERGAPRQLALALWRASLPHHGTTTGVPGTERNGTERGGERAMEWTNDAHWPPSVLCSTTDPLVFVPCLPNPFAFLVWPGWWPLCEEGA